MIIFDGAMCGLSGQYTRELCTIPSPIDKKESAAFLSKKA